MFKLYSKHKLNKVKYANDLVGCLGKLPLHSEFIKYKLALPELARLDQWYQRAYSSLNQTYGKKTKSIILQMPSYHYIYYAHDKMLPIVGIVMASQDQSSRTYPFTIFRVLANPLAREFHSAIPLIYSDYFKSLQTFCDFAPQSVTLEQLFTQIDSLNQTATSPSRQQTLENTVTILNTITLNDYWQEILKLYPELHLANFTQAIFNALQMLKTQPLYKSWGIRFPITPNPINITFWLQLIETTAINQKSLVQVFWNSNYIIIFFQPMPPEYLAYLVNPKIQSPDLFDITAESKKIKQVSELAKANYLEQPLLDILQKWSQ